jgi:hypothetical protein
VAPLGLEEEPGPLRVTAELPTQFQAGEPAVVAYQVEIASGLRAYAVEDQPPAGWRVVSFSPGGSYDAKNRKLKWGPFLDRQPRVLTYTVLPDLVSDGQAFTGVGSYDGYRVRMLGRRTVGAEVPASEVVRLEVSTQPYAWSVRGQPGAAYVVEVSSDLLHWQPLTNGTTDALGRWIFLPGSDAPCNFFRAMQPAALNGGTR